MKRTVKVLIADDNPNVRKTLRNILLSFDCVITEVETGEDALDEICREYFDVIFFDNRLPRDEGIEIIRKARELNLEMGRIFLMTGFPEKNMKSESQKLGVFHFQEKNDMDFVNKIRGKFNEAINM